MTVFEWTIVVIALLAVFVRPVLLYLATPVPIRWTSETTYVIRELAPTTPSSPSVRSVYEAPTHAN